MPNRARNRPLLISLLITCFAALCAATAIAAQLLPSVLASPGYESPTDACRAVSPATLQRAFGGNKPSRESRSAGEHDAGCTWQMMDSPSEFGSGRYGWLRAGAVTMLDEYGKPDINATGRRMREFQTEPGSSALAGLGEQASMSPERHGVRIVAARANLLVDVEYQATELDNGVEKPLPVEELEAVARQAAQDVLRHSGPPR